MSSLTRPSRITLAFGATSSANSSSVSFARSSWRIPIAVLTTATRPKIASAKSPSPTRTMKNAPRIALNRVKTFAATMLWTERELVGSTGPSRASSRSASAEVSPRVRTSFTERFIPERHRDRGGLATIGRCLP